jgi:hypothetical protein
MLRMNEAISPTRRTWVMAMMMVVAARKGSFNYIQNS